MPLILKAVLFNADGLAWCEVTHEIESIPGMLAPGDIGWLADAGRWTTEGDALTLAMLGSYTVNPVTREITF